MKTFFKLSNCKSLLNKNIPICKHFQLFWSLISLPFTDKAKESKILANLPSVNGNEINDQNNFKNAYIWVYL